MFKDRYILASTTLSLIFLQIMLWLLILRSKDLPSEVAFWYTQPTTDRLAPVSFLWIIPAIALICWLVDLIFGYWLYKKHLPLSRLMATISTSVCFLAAIAVVKTVLIYVSLF
jgi:hypothetical protein